MSQKILFTNDMSAALNEVLAQEKYNKLFVVTDVNVDTCVLPLLNEIPAIKDATKIVIKSGDVNKTVESLMQVWRGLGENGGTRHSLVLNIGGGMVTDLAGFAASTFKRGVRFINIPTTLLAAVDAAVGGKTGINFNGLKNEVGVFNEAQAVIISTLFFKTLPHAELKSGYAEMLKHGLLKGEECFRRLLAFDLDNPDIDKLLELLKESVLVKKQVVEEDPHEHGIRRALNLGHTVGHAFESMAMQRKSPIPHGYAVAWGMVVELVLANMKEHFSSEILHSVAQFVKANYGTFNITCDDYDALITLMQHDKKSHEGELNFTLLGAPGDIRIDRIATPDDTKVALDIYRDLFGL